MAAKKKTTKPKATPRAKKDEEIEEVDEEEVDEVEETNEVDEVDEEETKEDEDQDESEDQETPEDDEVEEEKEEEEDAKDLDTVKTELREAKAELKRLRKPEVVEEDSDAALTKLKGKPPQSYKRFCRDIHPRDHFGVLKVEKGGYRVYNRTNQWISDILRDRKNQDNKKISGQGEASGIASDQNRHYRLNHRVKTATDKAGEVTPEMI